MYFARPAKTAKTVPGNVSARYEDSSDEEDSNLPPPIKPLNFAPAAGLQTRNAVDTVPSITLTQQNANSLYPVKPPGGLDEQDVENVAKWQQEIAERRRKLEADPWYSFASDVAGFLDYQSVDPLLVPHVEWPTADVYKGQEEGKRMVKDPKPDAERRAAELFQEPVGGGNLHFSPAFTAAVRGSHADISNWFRRRVTDSTWKRLAERGEPVSRAVSAYSVHKTAKPPSVKEIICGESELRTQFARLVSLNMMKTKNLIRDGYHLEVDYDRVMAEKSMLLANIMQLITGSKKRAYN